MKKSLFSILDEILFINGSTNLHLANLLLDLKATDIRKLRSIRTLDSLLEIRNESCEVSHPLYRELSQWIQQNILVVTYCPHCGTKRDRIPIEPKTADIQKIISESHHYFCQMLWHCYPHENSVCYAFSYADEFDETVVLDDLMLLKDYLPLSLNSNATCSQ